MLKDRISIQQLFLQLIYPMMLINNTIYHVDVMIFFDFFNKNIIFVLSNFETFLFNYSPRAVGMQKTYLKQFFLLKCFILFNAYGIKFGLVNVPAMLLAPEL